MGVAIEGIKREKKRRIEEKRNVGKYEPPENQRNVLKDNGINKVKETVINRIMEVIFGGNCFRHTYYNV